MGTLKSISYLTPEEIQPATSHTLLNALAGKLIGFLEVLIGFTRPIHCLMLSPASRIVINRLFRGVNRFVKAGLEAEYEYEEESL